MANTNKKITYCRTCDQLTLELVQAINKKSIDQVTSTPTCENCSQDDGWPKVWPKYKKPQAQ